MIQLQCKKCGKSYQVIPSKELTSKYCSRVCHNTEAGKIGGRAGKGVSRNKGNKRPDLSLMNKVVKYVGENNARWKGDNAGYISIHLWVKRHYGKPKMCERCTSEKNVQWANKTHSYKRERDDWFQLCSSCHQKYDLTETKGVIKKFKNHLLNPEYILKNINVK